MTHKPPIGVSAVMWALGLLLGLAALTLAPWYLIDASHVVTRAAAARTFHFFSLSPGGTRELLAGAHLLFLAGLLAVAMLPSARRLTARMTGVAGALGLWEILVAVGGVFLGRHTIFAPPEMTVAAMGALLVLAAVGLNTDAFVQWLRAPKTPVMAVFTMAVVLGAAAFGLIGVLNARYYERVDYTRAGRYSLAPATVQLLEELDNDVTVTTVFVDWGDVGENEPDRRHMKRRSEVLRREVDDVLDEYVRRSSHVTVDEIDVRRDVTASKALATRMRAKGIEVERNCVLFECAATGRVMMVPAHQMIQIIEPEWTTEDMREMMRSGEKPKSEEPTFRFLGDPVFHRALAIVTGEKRTKLYFLVGHGEKPDAVGPASRRMPLNVREERAAMFSVDQWFEGLDRRYYETATLDLDKGAEDIPADCDVLVMAGPWCSNTVETWATGMLQPFSDEQADMVRKYLTRGGRLFVMLDPGGAVLRPMLEPLLALLAEYGVDVDPERAVIDEQVKAKVGDRGQIVLKAEPTSLFWARLMRDYDVDDDGERTTELHPVVRALGTVDIAAVNCTEVNALAVAGLQVTGLLETSPNGWTFRIPPPGEPLEQSENPERRSRSFAVAVERSRSHDPVMVVLGTSNMFIKPMIRFDDRAENEELALSILAWLSGNPEQLGVRSKAAEITGGETSPSAVRAVRFLSILIVPSFFVFVGAVIWLSRRK